MMDHFSRAARVSMLSSSKRSLRILSACLKSFITGVSGVSERLLFVLSGLLQHSRFGDYSHLELAQWITVFGYSIKWEFPQVKELAIRYIIAFEMDTIERIVLYRDTRLPKKYLLPLYMQIASREELLNLEESKRLGFDTLVCIHQARERLRSQVPINNRLLSPVRTDLKRTEVINIVASTFNISLTDASFDSGNTTLSSPNNYHLVNFGFVGSDSNA